MLSSSTPYSLLLCIGAGILPKKLPIPIDGSNTLPLLKPNWTSAEFMHMAISGEV